MRKRHHFSGCWARSGGRSANRNHTLKQLPVLALTVDSLHEDPSQTCRELSPSYSSKQKSREVEVQKPSQPCQASKQPSLLTFLAFVKIFQLGEQGKQGCLVPV